MRAGSDPSGRKRSLPLTCPGCGHPNRAQAKFCEECGASIQVHAARADRRQASVLFADISGYTALCARSDAEQVQAMLRRFYAAMDTAVETYGGRVFDRAGDAVMAVFGAPIAHGNDAERAVRAALAMHTSATRVVDCDAQPLRLHIGVASGEVVAAALRAGGESRYSVTGDTVNLAARLDALASAGDTLLSDALYRAVASVFDARSLGVQALKGLAEPVPVWKVTGLRAAPPERAPLVGRDAELAQLVAALEAARDSGTGTTILLRGDAGIGKSRLLEALRDRAEALGFGTCAGQVLDFGVGKGQDAIAGLLQSALGAGPVADLDAQRAAIQRAIARGTVSADEEVFINALLDVAQPPALKTRFDAMDNASRTRRSAAALAAVLQRSAQVQPRLASLEDMHWASADVLRHAAAIATATAAGRLVLLLTSRIEGDPLGPAWRESAPGSAWLPIDLAPLPLHAAQRLAHGLVEGSNRFAAQCVERAEGNPLFLVQLLRTQQDNEPARVPATIQSVVLERVDRLAGADRRALVVASVIGKRFSGDALQAIAGAPVVTCDALLGVDLVRRDGSGFQFTHALIQEAVYASTLKSERRELHRRAAAWFGSAEPVLQAEHLDRADDPAAARAYLAAAAQEVERFRYEAALRLSERGTELARAAPATDEATACELALQRGEVLREMGRSTESIAAFESAAELAQEALQRCHAWMGVAAGHRVTGDFDAAMNALARAQPVAEGLALPVECSKIHHMRGNLLFAQGKVDDCEAQHRLALAHAVGSGSIECEAQALSGLGDAQYARGRMRAALTHFERCVALCAGRAWVRIEGPNRCMTGHCLWYQNRIGSAIDEARRACDDAQTCGVVPVQVFAQTSLTQFLAEAGRNVEAEQACAQGLAIARAAGSRRYESTLLYWLAGLGLAGGQPDDARQHLEHALELARETGLGFAGAALFGRLARAVTTAPERAEALRQGEALLLGPGLAHGHLWFYRDAMEACLAAAEWDAALHYAAALEAFVSAEPLPWAVLIVDRCRALREFARSSAREPFVARLRQLRNELDAAGIGWALPAVDAALGG